MQINETTKPGMSDESDSPVILPTDALVRMRRPNGNTFLLRVPGEHLQRVMDLANGEFGDTSIDLGGPVPIAPKGR